MENNKRNGIPESVVSSQTVNSEEKDSPNIVISELKEKLAIALHSTHKNLKGNTAIMHSYAKKMDDKENLPLNVTPESHNKPNNVNAKIDDLLSNGDYFSDEENDSLEENSFLDMMAEEGEEDTPSEDSNAIIEVGEEINTTESEMSDDEDYDHDSFIDDDEENDKLLSGEEFDLSFEDSKRRRRIIELSSGSDDEIVRVKRKERKYVKKKNWSRIIRIDSSEEEGEVKNEENASKKEEDEAENRENTSNKGEEEMNGEDTSKEEEEVQNKEDTSEVKNKEDTSKKDDAVKNKEDTSTKEVDEVKNKGDTSMKIVILEDIKIQDQIILPFYILRSKEKEETVIQREEISLEKNEDIVVDEKKEEEETETNIVNLSQNEESEESKLKENEDANVNDSKNDNNEERTQNLSEVVQNEETKKEEATEEQNLFYPFGVRKTKLYKKVKKRKHPMSDLSIEPVPKKRRKQQNVQINPSRDLMQQAMLQDENNRLSLLDSGDFSDWIGEKVSLKPSRDSGTDENRNRKSSKEKSKKNVANKKFSKNVVQRDFKQMMLYDDKRVKRMKTGELLKKKMF